MLTEPEPCDDCDTGISCMTSYDGVRRCIHCVHEFAREMGFYDDPPEPPAPAPAPLPTPPPPPLPPHKAAKKEEIQEEGVAEDPQMTLL